MKYIKSALVLSAFTVVSSFLTGCAAGSATAGYAIKAQYADNLTAAAEQKIVDRTKAEIYAEMPIERTSCNSPVQN